MKIGFRSFITKRDMEIAMRLGIEVIEVNWEIVTKSRADEVKGLLREYGLKPSAMTVSSTSTPTDLEGFRKDFEFAESIGCAVYVAHLGPLTYKDRDAIAAFKTFWTPICKVAKDKGVKIAVQSCGLDPESWDVMLEAVPEFGLKYDPSFSAQAGRNYRMEVIKYGSFITHIHSKDEIALNRTSNYESGITHFRYVPSGMGDIHWASIIALLYEAGYKGDIAIEPHSGYWMENLEQCLSLSKRHLEQFIV
ncbi:sugar phosphate isomerase/epimerase family protein [Paenibacillus montanisoli]|nr:sugar phosphate isomerase/epimerase family protein [Paenibacillus montanisoli]